MALPYTQLVAVISPKGKKVRQYFHDFGHGSAPRERSERQQVAVAAVKAKFGRCFPNHTFIATQNG